MRNLKIKHKLFIFIIFGAFLTSFLGWLFVQLSQSLYDNLIYRETTDKFHLFSQRIEEKLLNIDKLSLSIMSDADVQKYLKEIKTAPGTYESYYAANELKKKLLTYHLFDYAVSSITILDTNNNSHGVGLNVKTINSRDMESLREKASEYKGASVWVGGILQDDAFFSLREIREIDDSSMEPLGTLLIRTFSDKIIYASPSETRYYDSTLLIVSEGKVIYPGQSPISYQEQDLLFNDVNNFSLITLNNQKYLAAHFTLQYTGWTFIHLVPYGSIFKDTFIMKIVLLCLYAIVLLIILLVGLRFSKSITQPIEKLTKKITVVEKGNFEVDKLEFPENRDEIGQLSRNFDKMIDKLDTLIKENYVKQIMLKDAEYNTLKAKLNPHFLYNTLDSINWLARMNGQQQISGMVKALGNLLRSTVNDKEFITLKEEISNLSNYIYIQQFRFEDRLVYHMQIEEHLHSLYIPCIILQPIVENSIKYGVETASEVCEITVYAEELPDRLVIIVKDTGPGMDAEYLNKLELNEITAKGTGIGLKSINERLKILFGEPYGISIESEPDKGTIIKISIPYTNHVA
ncbi:HAMP domain-containing protein [Paenibacillus sp. LMG 31456]|uniref:histidine kinase n=1 Tax=Paenibacillus foliorum TaxID=2654974 RepID=A0A972GRT9_9BACL|nr:sensor histidine kinase [Paenibacillus foliorum]NOU93033.1 HAMP domain-containing protein [Paenibacillus foliorum]